MLMLSDGKVLLLLKQKVLMVGVCGGKQIYTLRGYMRKTLWDE